MGDRHVGLGLQFHNRTHQSVNRRGLSTHFLHITLNTEKYAFQLRDSLVALIDFHFQIAQRGITGGVVNSEFQLLLFLQQSVLRNKRERRGQHIPVLVE